MKVLICLYQDSQKSGGSFRVAEVAVEAMLSLGMDVHVAVAYGEGGRIKQILGARCHLIGAGSKSDFWGWRRYRSLMRALEPDITHYVDAVGWMILAATGLHRRRIMHQHLRPNVRLVTKGGGARLLPRILFAGADRIVSISHGAAREMRALYKISEERVTVIHNAVNLSRFRFSLKNSGSARRLGMAIRIVEYKGVEDAIHLLAMLPDQFILAVAGQGPAMGELKIVAERLNVSHRIEWMGDVEDITQFYEGIDYYLFMSWYEGFGLSVAEAMASGRPVVGLLGDGEISEPEYPLVTGENSLLIRRPHGELASSSNIDILHELCDAILKIDLDRCRKEDMVNTARLWIEQKFSAQEYARKLCTLYDSVHAGA